MEIREASMKLTIKSVLLGLSLLLANGSVTHAQDYGRGFEAVKRGDFATALREWRPLAEQGNAGGQSNLGTLYDKGQGVIQDYEEAVKWYRLAAAQGNAVAQSNLGEKYLYGQGVAQDNVYAYAWYTISKINGYAAAVKYRDIAAEKMTAADISKAQYLASECVRKNYEGC
jgi:uncharacterized protein